LRVMTCKDCGEVTQEQIGADRPIQASAPDPDGADSPSTGIHLENRWTAPDGASTGQSKAAPTQKQNAEGALLNEDDDVCTVCGGELECYDAQGTAFCAAHAPPQREAG